MGYVPQSQGPFLKGVVASNSPLAQPKNAVSRASNLLLTTRGALSVCDGTQLVNAIGGDVAPPFFPRGRFESVFLFAPIGVSSYYMAIAKLFESPLGAPYIVNCSAGGSGGSLPTDFYSYRITALDGIGGETNASSGATVSVTLGQVVTLSWNFIPNAFGYNIYRSTSIGSETLLVGPAFPVLQPAAGNATVTYIDDGSATIPSVPIVEIIQDGTYLAGHRAAVTLSAPISTVGATVTIAGNSNSLFNGVKNVIFSSGTGVQIQTGIAPPSGTVGTGGTMTVAVGPPVSDRTNQVALYKMPSSVFYGAANIVALFPNSPTAFGTVPSGGSGGSGTIGPGVNGMQNSTPSGGIPGCTSLIPQMLQFTNLLVLALGNGFSPQLYYDSSGTSVNPAFSGAITGVSFVGDQVTITTSASLTAQNLPPGSNVILSMSDPTYSGVYPVVSVDTGAGTFIVRNTFASGGASTGTFTVSTAPIVNTFVPSYPVWTASTSYFTNSVVVPTTGPVSYFIAQGDGESGSGEPTWADAPNAGDTIADGTLVWKNGGLINASAPPPPGAGHIAVYSGALWALDTATTNQASGIDGPCALRMSNINNPNAWNPVNAAFLDKDDGQEGMGLASFTITAEGIPPEGSLVAFKQYSTYQITGVFGSTNFSIQRVKTDMGNMAPRTSQFLPGFGIARMTHLGNAVFDGVNDRLISEPIRPYLFPANDEETSDITVMDANWMAASSGFQTANPPMYGVAIPIGTSNGNLTRILCYDMVLKAWMIVDLPFSISCTTQARPVTSNPITIFGGTSDGVLQRWQAGDVLWYTGASSSFLSPVSWSVQTLSIASKDADQRLYARRIVIRGQNTAETVSGISNLMNVQVLYGANSQLAQNYQMPTSGDFDIFASVGLTDLRFAAAISGNTHVEVDGVTWHVEPRPVGVPLQAI